MTRAALPQRRPQETWEIEHAGHRYFVSVGRYYDEQTGVIGDIGEVFVQAVKTSSQVEALARDAAIAISLGIQHGCLIDSLQRSFTREEDGSPASLMGAVLDAIEVAA